MTKKLTAHEHPISRIFSDDYVFSIPGYQRPYAWTWEQAGELYDDLTGFINTNSGDISKMPPYFLGSIVLIKGETTPKAEVVDGQQRLTTLIILLSSIRHLVNEKYKEHITSLLYEKGNPIKGTEDRFRLSLREKDKGFFHNYIQKEVGLTELLELKEELSDSQSRIKSNASSYVQRLEKLSEQERLTLAQFIVKRCFLVTVATPDLDSAYRIFSVLNSRGLDLSATDILKAQIIGGISEKERIAYTKKWEDEEEELGRNQFGDLFSHIRMVYRKSKPQGTLLKEFEEHVKPKEAPKEFIDSILLPMAASYIQIVDQSYSSTEHAEEVNEYFKWLNKLGFSDWLPPALAYLMKKKNEPENVYKYFKDLERLGYYLQVTKAGINERIERFSKLTREIETDSDIFRAESVLQLSPHEQFMMYIALNGSFYKDLQSRARTPILLRLDSLLSGGGATYDYSVLTLEHVLPQNPREDSEWVDNFPDQIEREKLVHKLGNLVLLTRRKNSSAKNYDFDKKKSAYFRVNGVSPFSITTQVLQHEKWTPETINTRQKKLMRIFEEHWRLQDKKDILEGIL